jgi:hypothetical protein
MHRTSRAAATIAALAFVACKSSGNTIPNARASDANAAQERAHEQAVSTRPTESVGGQSPHPMPRRDATGQERFSSDEATTLQRPGPEGKTPESRVAGPQGQSADARDTVQGRIASVDQQQKEIAVDTGGATTQVRVADDAQITINGQRASLSDLKPGAEVRAALDRSGELPQAKRVEVQSKQTK